ncbi:hypothetical protein ABTX81_06490 [Kitasatospora sp. NPDC097605]|uniref:hypothetical protein n=1 Tax=Kitasatospora sp. NPDC097605 TaxID=3157226 RepID=UPI00332F1BC0
MNGVAITLRALYDGERRLEHDLLAAAERHRADHEVHHVATDVARWSHEHARRLAHAAPRYGLDLPGAEDDAAPGRWEALWERTAEALGRRPGSGLLLLHDLRHLHLAATENSLRWEELAQVAQATGDTRLLHLATSCHPQTLRQLRWTNAVLKTLSPHLLSSL